MKNVKKILTVFIFLALCISIQISASASVKISAKNIILIKGQSKILKITGTKSKVKWLSSKKSVATVTSKGKVTAKNNGSATITAQIGKKKYTCKVKVEIPKISNTKLTITKGSSANLKMSGTTQKVSWKSSNKNIATVTSSGNVKAIKTGSCTITATVGGKKYTCKITVKNKTTQNNGSVSCKSYYTPMGVVVIYKNTCPYTVQIEMDCLYYDSSGNILDKSSDSCFALCSNKECALIAHRIANSYYWSQCRNYSINSKVTKNSSVNVGHDIYISSSIGINSLIATFKNNGYYNNWTTATAVYYKNGKIIGADKQIINVNRVGETDIVDFIFPYDEDYTYVKPDDYKIYINESWSY